MPAVIHISNNALSEGPRRRVALILQARMGSTRLPKKSMLDLAGAPLVGRILERVKCCKHVDEIVLATTQKQEDKILEQLAKDYAVACFRGSENNLVDRYVRAAEAFDVDVIVRLPADNVAPEPAEIDRIIEYHLENDNAYSSNLIEIMGNGYPDGIGAEVIELWALREIHKNVSDAERLEHPHLNFFDFENDRPRDSERFKVGTVACPEGFRRSDLVIDVNTAEQYAYCKAMYEYLFPRNPMFHITDIIDWHDNVWLPTQSEKKINS